MRPAYWLFHVSLPRKETDDSNMFNIFKRDPLKALEKERALKLQYARHLQRKGDIVGFSRMATEADAVREKIEAIEERRA